MPVDPTLAAVLLAGGVAAAVALVESERGRRRRQRARQLCAACGRRILEGLRTCGCDV